MRSDPAYLVVLDLMNPGIDGLEVCRRLRASTDVPIIVLTAFGRSRRHASFSARSNAITVHDSPRRRYLTTIPCDSAAATIAFGRWTMDECSISRCDAQHGRNRVCTTPCGRGQRLGRDPER